jgi:hypothetical protein
MFCLRFAGSELSEVEWRVELNSVVPSRGVMSGGVACWVELRSEEASFFYGVECRGVMWCGGPSSVESRSEEASFFY